MAKKPLPSPEVLRQLLRYEPDTGKLFWLPRPVSMFEDGAQGARQNCAAWNGRYAWKEAMTAVKSDGYKHGALFYHYIPAHRVIWALQTGQWPSGLIDHADGDKMNNRWENLRSASYAENGWNRGASSQNRGGVKGVRRAGKKWTAQMTINGTTMHLGTFACRTAAAYAYAVASRRHHGRFSNAVLA
jgi:hypothetical protein